MMHILSHPMFRLLAVNFAAGVALAVLLVGGLLATDAHGLRSLIMQDGSPMAAIALLLGGFIVTCASVMMGTAIMGIGKERE